ncbi:hypothetical protein PPSIR1_27043 [Plesiocystis pacifica SIR-1]|uniref:Uncharacterized protein n=1 Tax=Plesiocystis pacifica SIR-1 TaxID=391625 RepID=A6GKQ3_9BACT|nr:hypothetical protein [Plesiocystis pacifica]EDM73550.1 hypothetical protein PPSIR1_27043 [Plesiocystis pacifica SIR-1]
MSPRYLCAPVERLEPGRRWRRASFALLLLGVISGCPDQDPGLDAALRDYLEQREAEVEQACKCFQNLLDPSTPSETFESELACRTAFAQPEQDEALGCMRGVLDESSLDDKESVAALECYTRELSEATVCHEENAGVCDPQACSSDVVLVDTCQGKLTDEQAQALYYCAVK